jgi:hypothetical protein
MPFHSALCRDLERSLSERPGRGLAGERRGRGMACVNPTRPHSVNQMGKTQSKPLGERHGNVWLTPRKQAWTCFCERCAVSQTLIPVECTLSRPHLHFGTNGILRRYVTAECASFRSSIVSLATRLVTEASGKFRQWVMSWPRIDNEPRRQVYAGLVYRSQLWSLVAVQLSGQRIIRHST